MLCKQVDEWRNHDDQRDCGGALVALAESEYYATVTGTGEELDAGTGVNDRKKKS